MEDRTKNQVYFAIQRGKFKGQLNLQGSHFSIKKVCLEKEQELTG